jgi:tetratricopeptide (TPR) repeat protein
MKAGAPPAASAAPPALKHDFELDLPTVSGARASGPRQSVAARPSEDDDLFADLPTPVADLPAPVAARGLAKPAAPAPSADLPALAPARKVPSIKQTMAFSGELDLPDLVTNADLPSPASVGLPAAVSNVGLPSLASNVGLPAVPNVGLPAQKPGPPKLPPAVPRGGPPMSPAAAARTRGTATFGEIDLPSLANDLPTVANDLPAVASSLPSVAGSLPSLAGSLPAVASSLPTVAGSLPSVANALPAVANALPAMQNTLPTAQRNPSIPAAFGDDFGELELPRQAATSQAAPPQTEGGGLFDENPFTSVAPAKPTNSDDGGFGELELPVPPDDPSAGFGAPDFAPSSVQGMDRGGAGGMAFGELDLGGAGDTSSPFGGDDMGEASLGSIIQPPPVPGPAEVSRLSQMGKLDKEDAPGTGEVTGTVEATIESPAARSQRERKAVESRGPSPLPKILGGFLAIVLIGGGALTLTPYGAFGSNVVSDAIHKDEYAKAASAALDILHDGLKDDVFSESKAAADKLAAARAARPRARTLTSVAAIAEFETELRFGKEADRANRAKLWLTSDMPEPRASAQYYDVAMAGAAALDRDNTKAKAAFDAAARKYAGDPIAQDVAFMSGQLALRTGDGAGASAAFGKALSLAPGARAHFGLAQAAMVSGDLKTAGKELDATILASPKHGAALVVRAQLTWSLGREDSDAEAALKDLATLLEGPAKDSISTSDQAEAYALRGVIQFARGRTVEARKAFDEALKVDSRNVSALVGQGDVFYDEGRYTEAVGRYDTAKGVDPNSTKAIVGDAKTLIALERLADAKTELLDAVKRFPKSAVAMRWLAICVSDLGGKKEAEKDFLAAIGLLDPKDPEAIDTYAAYATFLAAEGRADEATATLADAQKKLPDNAALERALGDVAEMQGHHADAIVRYRAAIAKDSQDTTSRFRLGQALRRNNMLEEASKVFDDVYTADKSYPGLSLERGILFEQSGHVEDALAQFQKALEKAPNDPDLTLRVGEALVAIGKPEDALPKLKDVLKQRPNSAEAEHYIGRALMLEGGVHAVEAMRHLRTAADKDPNSAEYHLYVGWLANDEEQPELTLARKEIDRALELDKTLADAYWQRGVNEAKVGANDDALKDLRLALQLKPTRYEAHASLAQVYEQKNQPDQAIAEWNMAFAHDDSNEFWNFRFGKLLLAQGRYVEAAKRLKAATEAGEAEQPRPGWLVMAEFPAAEALRRAGDRAGAIAHYNAFLQHADSNDPNMRDAQRALRDLGAPYQE